MTKHKYEVIGIHESDEKEYNGKCISDDIRKIPDMFREHGVLVHQICKKEQVHVDNVIGVIKIESANSACYWTPCHDVDNKIYMPDMRPKIEEYITELDQEIDRCDSEIKKYWDEDACKVAAFEARAQALIDVKNDLQGRLEELV